MTSDEKAVFHVIANCEVSSYSTCMHPKELLYQQGILQKCAYGQNTAQGKQSKG